jgi:hypothetical protein
MWVFGCGVGGKQNIVLTSNTIPENARTIAINEQSKLEKSLMNQGKRAENIEWNENNCPVINPPKEAHIRLTVEPKLIDNDGNKSIPGLYCILSVAWWRKW